MYPNPGGFSQQDPNNAYPGHQPQAGYPPQGANLYLPQVPEFSMQQHGYHPEQQPYPPQSTGYSPQPVGYLPQQIPGMLQGPTPQDGGIYPSGSGLPYGLAPNMSPSQQSGYPISGTGYPSQQPYGYPGAQHPLPSSGGTIHYPNLGSAHTAHPVSSSGSNIEISIACTNLKDADVMSKSDPVCVLFEKRSGTWAESGRTEMIKDTHHPKWQKKFMLNYNPQINQELKFEIYDWDSKSQKLKRHDILGQVEASLGTIMSSPGKQFTSSLKKGGGGRITIMAEEIKSSACERIRLQLMANKLDKKDTFGKSDPFYNLSKKMPNGQWSLVYKSEVIKNNSNPRWSAMDKPITELCNGDYERELKVEIFDYDSTGQNDLIGEFTTNLRSLSSGVRNQSEYEVINSKKQRNTFMNRNYKNSGIVSVLQFNSR